MHLTLDPAIATEPHLEPDHRRECVGGVTTLSSYITEGDNTYQLSVIIWIDAATEMVVGASVIHPQASQRRARTCETLRGARRSAVRACRVASAWQHQSWPKRCVRRSMALRSCAHRVIPSDNSLIGVTSEQLGLRDGVISVMGQGRKVHDFVLFASLDDFDKFGEASDASGAPGEEGQTQGAARRAPQESFAVTRGRDHRREGLGRTDAICEAGLPHRAAAGDRGTHRCSRRVR